jgi:hypothetical protein
VLVVVFYLGAGGRHFLRADDRLFLGAGGRLFLRAGGRAEQQRPGKRVGGRRDDQR